MAKDAKTIHGSVRVGGDVFIAGQEEDLAKALPAGDVERLTEMGIISGFSSKAEKAVAKGEETDEASKEAKGKDSDKK